MTARALATPTAPLHPAPVPTDGAGYVPGVCNIGPWEIRRRRAFGVVGLAAAVVLYAALVAAGVPALARAIVLLPAWGGVFSWLQARRHFCAGFAWAGIANFGDGEASRRSITDPAARRADLAAVGRMARDSFLVALALAAVAVLLPR
jgi:hypothetical protein